MKIANIELIQENEYNELRADVFGDRLWYRTSAETPLQLSANPFLCAALQLGMARGEDIEIVGPYAVSGQLLENFELLQQIYSSWFPDLLQKVSIRCDNVLPTSSSAGESVFFSGGVDSSYSFLQHEEKIENLIFVHGVDMQHDNDELFDRVILRTKRFAEHFGKNLIVVTTNIRALMSKAGLSWSAHYGAGGLGSIANAIGASKVYVGANLPYKWLAPDGTHPLTNMLFSTEGVSIFDDGGVDRSEKLAAIGEHPIVLETLRVCWKDDGYNCGQCEKCLRTMIAIELLGLSTDRFPPLTDLRPLAKIPIFEQGFSEYILDLIILAERVGRDDIRKALRKPYIKFQLKQCVKKVDQLLLGGRLQSRFSKPS